MREIYISECENHFYRSARFKFIINRSKYNSPRRIKISLSVKGRKERSNSSVRLSRKRDSERDGDA